MHHSIGNTAKLVIINAPILQRKGVSRRRLESIIAVLPARTHTHIPNTHLQAPTCPVANHPEPAVPGGNINATCCTTDGSETPPNLACAAVMAALTKFSLENDETYPLTRTSMTGVEYGTNRNNPAEHKLYCRAMENMDVSK